MRSLLCDLAAEPGIVCSNGVPRVLEGYWAYLTTPQPGSDGRRRLRAVLWCASSVIRLLRDLHPSCLLWSFWCCNHRAFVDSPVHSCWRLCAHRISSCSRLYLLSGSPPGICNGGEGSAENMECARNRLPAADNPLCGKCAANHTYAL